LGFVTSEQFSATVEFPIQLLDIPGTGCMLASTGITKGKEIAMGLWWEGSKYTLPLGKTVDDAKDFHRSATRVLRSPRTCTG